MKYIQILITTALLLSTSCQAKTPASKPNKAVPPTLKAPFVSTSSVKVDGQLNEPIWQKAPTYPLSLGRDNARPGQKPQESGTVQLAWDNTYFYVAVRFTDSDIVAEGKKDELRHFELGDLCELFLKPDTKNWYWELYATPRGHKTSFFFPGKGRRGLPSNQAYTSGLTVAAQCLGTLEKWQDRDKSWTAEMAMPIKDLNAPGYPFTPENKWRILIARYNYSCYIDNQGPELTMCPQLPQTNYHLHSGYGYLELTKD